MTFTALVGTEEPGNVSRDRRGMMNSYGRMWQRLTGA